MIKFFHTKSNILLLIIILAHGCNSDNESKIKIEKKSTEKNNQNINFIECRGYISPKQKFSLRLRAGERIIKYLINKPKNVLKGQPLVWIANDSLVTQIISQRERNFEIKKNIEELKIQSLEIEIFKREIDRLKKQISEERNIAKLIKDYPLSIQEKKINDEIKLKKNRLKFLLAKKHINKELIKDQEKIQRFTSSHVSDINNRLSSLIVKAPFTGRIVQLNQNPQWAAPGEVILEMWDEKQMLVKAEVWQHQLQYIKINSASSIFPDYYTNYELKGKVIKIGNVIQTNKNGEYPRFPIEIKLEKTENKKIRVGMIVLVKIKINKNELNSVK